MRQLSLNALLLLLCLFVNNSYAQNTLKLDGANDVVNLGNAYNFDVDEAFSVEAWIKAGSSSQIGQIISKFDANFRGWGFQVKRDNYPAQEAQHNGVLSFYISHDWNNGSVLFVDGTTNLRDNQWHHVACTYDGSGLISGIHLYIDGEEEGIPTPNFLMPGATSVNNATTLIGALDVGGNPTEFYNGTVDELRIWDGVRSLANLEAFRDVEITCLPQNSLLGYYNFNEGIANGNNGGVTVLNDASGNGNNGTLTNFALSGTNSNWTDDQPVGGNANFICDCINTTYCKANGLDDDMVYTNSVSTVNFDNINSGSSDGYGDYRGQVIDMYAGGMDVVKVTRETSGFSVGTTVWIDWNQDGVFGGNELVVTGTSTNAVILKAFLVPNNALSGHTRMRVVTQKNVLPLACGIVQEGEVEDYCVNVRTTIAGGGTNVYQYPSAFPYPNPVYIGGRITTTTTSIVTHALLVDPITGQNQTIPVGSSKTSPTGGVSSILYPPSTAVSGLYNLVLITQDGTIYSDNIRIR